MSDDHYGLKQEVEEFEKNTIETLRLIVAFVSPDGVLLNKINQTVKKYQSSAGFLE